MPNIQTLDGLKATKQDSSDSSDDEQGQAFYAGGSDTSGQQILGPPRQGNREGLISDILMQSTEVSRPSSDTDNPRSAFSGVGYVLGNSAGSSRPINASSGNRVTEVSLKFWKDGFSINDGPLYLYTDPAGQEILKAIRRGEVTEELGNISSGEVQLNIEDHRHSMYNQSKASSRRAFAGAGCVLGSTATTPVESVATPGDAAEQSIKPSESAPVEVKMDIDESKPVTSVQIRLEDSSRLVGRFNLTHTVGDIRDYIIRSRPNYVDRPFALFQGFPRIELDDSTKTIADAGLQNSALIQRVL